MLKPFDGGAGHACCLITVQDNTMLKLCRVFALPPHGLITVQDNTMLKLAIAKALTFIGLITVQDNTMLKLPSAKPGI